MSLTSGRRAASARASLEAAVAPTGPDGFITCAHALSETNKGGINVETNHTARSHSVRRCHGPRGRRAAGGQYGPGGRRHDQDQRDRPGANAESGAGLQHADPCDGPVRQARAGMDPKGPSSAAADRRASRPLRPARPRSRSATSSRPWARIYSGADLKVLMVMTPYGDEQIWGAKKYKTLKDAKGQPWAVASLGGAQRFNAQMAVQGMGLATDAFRWTAIAGADGTAPGSHGHRSHATRQPVASRRRARQGQGLYRQGSCAGPPYREVHPADSAPGGCGKSKLDQGASRRCERAMSR